MGMEAVGAYLRTLREAQHIKRVALAQELGIYDVQIERIERGAVAPQSPFLLLLIHAVHGDLEQVSELILDPEATATTGHEYAMALLVRRSLQAELHVRWHEVQQLLEQLRRSPRQLEH